MKVLRMFCMQTNLVSHEEVPAVLVDDLVKVCHGGREGLRVELGHINLLLLLVLGVEDGHHFYNKPQFYQIIYATKPPCTYC